MIGQGPPKQKHYIVVHLRMEANAEYKKETVTVMMTAFGIWNVEQEIAKTKILCWIFQLFPIAAMTLFQVRYKRV